jgi:drug/metabolite transporter (DMT)-like permease
MNKILGIENIHRRGWLGVASSFVGILLLINMESVTSEGSSVIFGELLLIAATVFWSLYTVLSQPVLESVRPLDFTTYTFALGTPFLYLFSIRSFSTFEPNAISWLGWGSIVYSGVILAFSYIVWNLGIKKIGSTRTSVYDNLTPVVSVLFAWQFLGEQLLSRQLMGAVLVFLGVYLTRFSK